MKAFEEWRDRQEKAGVEQGYRYGNRVAWRAALEWALTHREMGYCVTNRRVIPAEAIEKELETEK
jgi:hypothetical protein